MKTSPLAEVHAEQVVTRLRRRDGALDTMAADLINQLRQRVGEAVACDVIAPDGRVVASRVDLDYADNLLSEYKWADCHKGNYLYASPPATVGVGALRELVRKWHGITTNTDIEYGSRVFIEGYDKALNYCADELATLIGEKA